MICGQIPIALKGPKKNYCPACHAERFIEGYCTHTKGRWAGQPFSLLPWQRDEIIRPLFGTLRPDGGRQYRICYVEVPKKNGKSEIGAGVALYLLFADDEQGAEVYGAAADRGQAELIYNVVAQMIRNKSALEKKLKIIDSRRRIVDYRSNSYYQVLSADVPNKHGLNPHGILFDEIHAQPNHNLWDVLTFDTDYAREQQLIFVMTTAGIYDKESIWWKIRERARQIKSGIIKDDSFLPVIYAAEEKDDPSSQKVWERVNPSLGYIFSMEKVQKDFEKAKENPLDYNKFLRFRLNIATRQITKWLPMEDWDKGSTPFDKELLLKRTCFGGLDLSSSIDLTAFALVFPPILAEEKFKVLMKFYMPENNMDLRIRRDGVPYDIWQQQGFLTATPGNVIDYAYIRNDVKNASKIYRLKEVAYDPWGAVKLAVELGEEDGITMIEHRQGWKSMSPPTKELLVKVKTADLQHGGNPILRWNADNMVVRIDPAENVKPDKEKATERIDGIVAMIMALGRALLAFQKTSVYQKRGLLSVG